MKTLKNAILFMFLLGLPAQAIDALSLGRFEVTFRKSPLVIAAPHGGYDTGTEEMARRIAQILQANCIVAMGFRTVEHPINVNRPTEGVRLSAASESFTADARVVYDAYRTKIQTLKPVLYVELHANIRPESANAIETATVGLTSSEAQKLKSHSGLPVLIEPIDRIHYQATGTKKSGILGQVPFALHFELPTAMREPGEGQEKTIRELASIIQSALMARHVATP